MDPVLVAGIANVGTVTMPTWTEGVEPPLVVTSEVHLKRGAVSAGVGLPATKTIALAKNSEIGNCMLDQILRGG